MSDKMKEAFEQFLINEMGPHVLAGNTMSMYDAMQKAWQASAADTDCRGVVEKLVEVARKVDFMRHADNAVGARFGFVPDRTDKAVDELVEALAQAEKFMGRK